MDTNPTIVRAPNEELPTLTPTQCWCCAEGCGKTEPVLIDFNYWEARDAETGRLIHARRGKVWRSACCHSNLELWDDGASQGKYSGNFIAWSPLNSAEIDAAVYDKQPTKEEA